ncbi:hypothetical protein FHW89_001367 [Mucilaginibacter sp. SG564]|nr:hypothetical protein [Mucilaginibacter sp. SG564]
MIIILAFQNKIYLTWYFGVLDNGFLFGFKLIDQIGF